MHDPPSPKCWDYRCKPLKLGLVFFSLYFFGGIVGSEFELRALCMQSRLSTTVPFFFRSFGDRGELLFAQTGLEPQSSQFQLSK
jgi:hypothetical protein